MVMACLNWRITNGNDPVLGDMDDMNAGVQCFDSIMFDSIMVETFYGRFISNSINSSLLFAVFESDFLNSPAS